MRKFAAIALLIVAPGLLTFGIALACLYTMPVCHVMQAAKQHPCCAKQPAANRDATPVRHVSMEVAPVVVGAVSVMQTASVRESSTRVVEAASPPIVPLRV